MRSAKTKTAALPGIFFKKLTFGIIPVILLFSGAFTIGLGITEFSPTLLGFPQYSKGLNYPSLIAGIVLWLGTVFTLYVAVKNGAAAYALAVSYLMLVIFLLISIGVIFTPAFDFMGFQISMRRSICPLHEQGYYSKSPATSEVLSKICNSI